MSISGGKYTIAGFSSSYPIQGWLWPKTPNVCEVNPVTGSWKDTPHNVKVSCMLADKIFYNVKFTADGKTPAEPNEPSEDSNDGFITGNSGNFQIWGEPGKLKKIKVRFRGKNYFGYGPTTPSSLYTIDLR
jgi:hypothetical protein